MSEIRKLCSKRRIKYEESYFKDFIVPQQLIPKHNKLRTNFLHNLNRKNMHTNITL